MIIPAIDLLGGKTVRLFKGDYSTVRYYNEAPLELIQNYAEKGAELIHIVDLEGARDPSRRQLELIKAMVASTRVQIQTGGGIRSDQDITRLMDAGVSRVVLGSRAINDPDTVGAWIGQFGSDHLVLALDVILDDQGKKWLPTNGWRRESGKQLENMLDYYLDCGVQHVLCTDISRDGTLSGPNHALYRDLIEQYPTIRWQASGGIGNLNDIRIVSRTGVSGVIIGKALLDKKFELQEAAACWLAE